MGGEQHVVVSEKERLSSTETDEEMPVVNMQGYGKEEEASKEGNVAWQSE